MKRKMVVMSMLAALLVCGSAAAAQGTQQPKENPYEKDIRAFEAKDRESPPPQGAVLLVGSSTIRLWDVAKSFQNVPVIKRGFGGSAVADSVHFAERIILPYKPKTIVFYAGDNDIAGGKTPEQVFADFNALVKKVHDALPETRILFLSIKPSIARWALVDKMRQVNRMVEELTKTDKRLEYVDVHTPMLGEDGKPRADLLREDGLHLNDKGYALWTSILTPRLAPQKEEPAKGGGK